MMAARRWASIVVGLFLLLLGTIFALQGANVIKGSAVMSGNSTYIYVGGLLAVIGLMLIIVGATSRSR
jgi:tetrahydromethanopterin S-methyltransferase subunit C